MIKQYLTDWKMWTMIIAGISLLGSIFNYIIQNRVHAKLSNNELKHIIEDVTELKKEHKELKIDLRKDLKMIFRRLGRIEKAQGIQKAICDERHGKK